MPPSPAWPTLVPGSFLSASRGSAVANFVRRLCAEAMDPAATAARFARRLERDGSPVVITWREATGGTYDPVRQLWTGETVTDKTTVPPHPRAASYSPHYAQLQVIARWAEQPVEPVLLDFAAADVAALLFPAAGTRITAVRFAFDGRRYAPAKHGRELTAASDALVAGVPIARTILVGREG